MDRRESTIRLSEDAVDQNGVAILADATMPLNEDAEIAPWIDMPPTPPPKTPLSKGFGFTQKASSFSLVSLRHNSHSNTHNHNNTHNNHGQASSALRSSESQASLYIPNSSNSMSNSNFNSLSFPASISTSSNPNGNAKRRSTDDNESYTGSGLIYSGSSSHSGGGLSGSGTGGADSLRKQKSSIFARLKARPSKPKLRDRDRDREREREGEELGDAAGDAEGKRGKGIHPSLRPPIPPLPEQRPPLLGLGAGVLGLGGTGLNLALPLPSLGGGGGKDKEKEKEKAGKKKAGHGKVPPTPPPKDGWGTAVLGSTGHEEWRAYSHDLDIEVMDGILKPGVVSAGLGVGSSIAGVGLNGSAYPIEGTNDSASGIAGGSAREKGSASGRGRGRDTGLNLGLNLDSSTSNANFGSPPSAGSPSASTSAFDAYAISSDPNESGPVSASASTSGLGSGSSSFRYNQHPFVPASEFSDPFAGVNGANGHDHAGANGLENGLGSGSRSVLLSSNSRKVSPTSIPVPPVPSSSSHADASYPLPHLHAQYSSSSHAHRHPLPPLQPLQSYPGTALSLSPSSQPPSPTHTQLHSHSRTRSRSHSPLNSHTRTHSRSPVRTPTSGPGSPTWVPPESWAVERGAVDPYNNPNVNLDIDIDIGEGVRVDFREGGVDMDGVGGGVDVDVLDEGSEGEGGYSEGAAGGMNKEGAGASTGGEGSKSEGREAGKGRDGKGRSRSRGGFKFRRRKGGEKAGSAANGNAAAAGMEKQGQPSGRMRIGSEDDTRANFDLNPQRTRDEAYEGEDAATTRDKDGRDRDSATVRNRYPYLHSQSLPLDSNSNLHPYPGQSRSQLSSSPPDGSYPMYTNSASNSDPNSRLSKNQNQHPNQSQDRIRNPGGASFSSLASSLTSTATTTASRISTSLSHSLSQSQAHSNALSPSLSHSHSQPAHPRSTPRGSVSHHHPHSQSQIYKMRIYRPNNTYHVISIDLDTSVADLIVKLTYKLLKEESERRVQHNLYLREGGRERMLGPQERPAAIVKLRMEQAGYDPDDGQHLLGAEGLNILLKFFFKSQLLAGEEQISLENYGHVNLTSRGLRTIPVVLHQNADSIVSLYLDRNPMIEIPLDFIQACTTLRELKMTNMSMKKVPQSLRHSTTLHKLNLSSNCIRDLDEAFLDHIPSLMGLQLQNNRLEKMPWYFPRLRCLSSLNISNNKFRAFPTVVTQLESLKDLDISFNMLHELPEDIGKMRVLERFLLVGNHIAKFPDEVVGLVSLKTLDCRRNQIADLGLVCMLPQLQHLSADWNSVHVVDLSLGENLRVLELAHNDVTQLSLVPGPMGRPPYGLTVLDLSYAKLSNLDDIALSQLSSLRILRLDHNSIRSIPESLGELRCLETLSCTDNKLDALPSTIGKLGKLKVLDAHNNSLTELPGELWECASLEKVNVTSNFISAWADPPVPVGGAGGTIAGGFGLSAAAMESPTSLDGHLSVPGSVVLVDGPFIDVRKQSLSSASIQDGASINNYKDTKESLPPLARSLRKLYIGENCLSGDGVLRPLMIFVELRVLNLSFNEIQDLPPSFFRNMNHLEEIYLSGNKLTSIPAEDLPRLTKLRTLYLNGNKLHTLPQELGKVASLMVLDVGSNYLKYNINNWEFDWNWNFNTNLRYLNLSGNKRLQIKADSSSQRLSRHSNFAPMLSGFTSLSQLRVLGLMDVTITTTAKDTTVDIPDENADRRVRTSLSTVCGMSYGIADSLGNNEYLTMIDLVHEFHGNHDEAIFAMFGRTQPIKLKPGTSPNPFSKFLHDNFVNVFRTQLDSVNDKVDRDGEPLFPKKEGIRKALHWTFLKLNQEIWENLVMPRKNSQMGFRPAYNESQYYRMGVSGIALYFFEKTMYAANVGDALAVVSRQGVCHEISRKHDPYDRLETARIRAAEGSISATGLVNDEVDVSRSFGYYYLFPPINARPDIFIYNLTEMDEFVIIANRGLWDYVPYQTAVDIARTVARTERPDPMLAAEKLRDFAISYGADGSTMIMVIWVADLFNSPTARSRQPTLDTIIDPQKYKAKRKGEIRDRLLDRLDGEVPPPIGHVTIVFTDIRNSTHLWEANPGMPTAMRLHNSLLRRQLRFCGGYEVKTEGDSFMCSFPTTLAAVWWCLTVQVQLLHESWPLEILECEDGKPIYDAQGQLIARGLSVRMGIHSGNPFCETDLITNRMDYFGPMVNRSARINSSAQGGQIMCSQDIVREINARVFETEEETEYSKLQNPAAVETIKRLGVIIKPVGEVKLKGIELPEILSVLYPSGLEGRHELKESPEDPSASSGSPFRLNVAQVKLLGILTLRIEATSSGRVFKPLLDRKASIQSNPETEDSAVVSKTFHGDPNLLLPSINDNSSEADLLLVLDSLATRLENALDAIGNRYHVPLSPAVDFLMSTLMRDGALDRETLDYIASILGR